MKISIGSVVRSHIVYMIDWRGIVTGYAMCIDINCIDPECAYVVEWTVPGTENKRSMTHLGSISEIPAMVYLAEQIE